MNQAMRHNPYAAPPTPPMAAPTLRYEDVPVFRRNWLNSLFVFVGFFVLPPLLWATCVIVLTGPVYMNAYDERGQLKQWGPANKVVAAILLSFQVAMVIWALVGK